MLNAKDKFKKGDKVRLTEYARSFGIGISGRNLTGIVVGFGRRGYSVWVIKDGCKTKDSYHMDFWEKA